jgi:hypothetical protein
MNGLEVKIEALVQVPEEYLRDYPTDAERRVAAREYVTALMHEGATIQCVCAESMPFKMRVITAP